MIKSSIKKLLRLTGFDIVKYVPPKLFGEKYPDFDADSVETILNVQQFTKTSPEAIYSLCEAVKYIIINDIPGEIVECGVWKGGSMMAIARTLKSLKNYSKHLFMFDTFEGMPAPTPHDVDRFGRCADQLLAKADKEDSRSIWCYATIESVKELLIKTEYDSQKLHFIKGLVEETIPTQAPNTISLLRLDTDWYESTRHELVHLFPRLSIGGVIIIDDYGYWKGARQAVDEYINNNKIKLLLNRVDLSLRIGVKMS